MKVPSYSQRMPILALLLMALASSDVLASSASSAALSPRSARRLARIRQSIREATPASSLSSSSKSEHQRHARQLLEKTVLWEHENAAADDVSTSSISKFHQSVANTASTVTNRRHRLLQETTDDCPFEGVFTGNCTLKEYCTHLDALEPDTAVTCSGNVAASWDLVSTSTEQCLYFGENSEEPFPFDAARYNALTDVCFQIVVTITFETFLPSQYTRQLAFTRPQQEAFSETSTLTACDEDTFAAADNNNNNNQPIPGFCTTCTSAAVGKEQCNSCATCPADSAGNKLLDCSNLSPTFVTNCAQQDDDVFLPFGEYLGIVCTFDALAAGTCPLDKFCNVYQAVENPETIDCDGNISEEWYVQLAYEEECYYTPLNPDEEPTPYDASKFDATAGHYCSKVAVQIDFKGTKALTEEYTEVFTRPVESMGELSVVRDLFECSNDADYEFATPVCARDCGDLTVGQEVCTSGCRQCSAGGQVLTCTNVDPTLVESCNAAEDQVTAALLAHFRQSNQQEAGNNGDDGSAAAGDTNIVSLVAALVFCLAGALLL